MQTSLSLVVDVAVQMIQVAPVDLLCFLNLVAEERVAVSLQGLSVCHDVAQWKNQRHMVVLAHVQPVLFSYLSKQ